MTDFDFSCHCATAMTHLAAAQAALATGDRTKADACADAAHEVLDYVCVRRAAEAAGLRDLAAASPEEFVVVTRHPAPSAG